MSISGALADATRRTAGALLPHFDFTRPVLDVVGKQQVHRIAASQSSFRGVLQLIKGRADSLIVTHANGELAGILTEADFLKLPLETGFVRRTAVSELMTPAAALKTVPTTATVLDCVAKMSECNIRHVPALDAHGVLKAVVGLPEVGAQVSDTLSKREAEEHLTVGDIIDEGTLQMQTFRSLPASASVQEALALMRGTSFHAVLVSEPSAAAPAESAGFGIFTERDYVHNVLPYLWYEEQTPADIALGSVARWAYGEEGHSKRTLQRIADNPTLAATWRPTYVTCVERSTPVRDCLALMLGNGLLYVPVIEDERPVDVVSLKDVTLHLARDREP